MSRCLEQALRQMRHRRVEWGQGEAHFVTEPGVERYPYGTYPRVPGDIMSVERVLLGTSALGGAVLRPDTLVSSTNLELDGGDAATITPLQDSAESPDDTDLHPASAGNTDFVVRWDVALARPLVPGTVATGAATLEGRQLMRVAMWNEGTDRSVSWTVKEGVTTIATGSWTVDSPSRKVYEARWDASGLSTLNPDAEQVSLTVADGTGTGEVHYSAVQWFVASRDERLSLTGGAYPIEVESHPRVASYLGQRLEVITGIPVKVASYRDALTFYPTPNGSYLVKLVYQKDSTKDTTTGETLDKDSTTQTSSWFDDGFVETACAALEIYYSMRPGDVNGVQLAQLQRQNARAAQDLAYEMEVFQHPPKGDL